MPPKVTAQDVQQLDAALGSLTLKEDLVLRDAHPRPGFGSKGQPITVEANMFQVRYNKSVSINHYDVDITPVVKVANQKMPKPLAGKIWAQACRDHGNGPDALAFKSSAFDLQKNVYTPDNFKLDGKKKEIIVELPEPGREVDDRRRFKVTLKLANVVDLQSIVEFCQRNKQSTQDVESVATAIQAINVLLRQDPSERYTPMGARGRFFGMDGAIPISAGGLVAKGFMQSFRPTNSGLPAIQLDTAFTALFKSGPLLRLVPEILGLGGGPPGGRGGRGGFRGGPRGGPRGPGGGHGSEVNINDLSFVQIKSLKKLLYGAKFTLPYKNNDRQFTLKNISLKPASDVTFILNGKNGEPDRNIGLIQYYKQNLNITIQKPRLPCVIYGKNFMVPMELVHMSDFNAIPFSSLSADQAADMIRVAAQKPMDRSQAIKDWRTKLNYSSLPKLRSWGIEVNNQMMRVNARVLPPPKVTYARGKTLNCAFGGWNLKGVGFTRPGEVLKSWAVVSFDSRFDVQAMRGFIEFLLRTMEQYGVRVGNRQPSYHEAIPGPGPSFPGVVKGLQDAARQAFMQSRQNPQLVIVIMPRRDTAMYQEIKNAAAMRLKEFVTTQCLQSAKLRSDRGLDQYCANVAMKIQAKLGGVTHEVPIPATVIDKTTMIVGADVTHPPGGRGRLQPSIACSVAGTTGENVKWDQSVRSQEGRLEIISDLGSMMLQHIKTFEKNTGAKPGKILFFRDGVSEGQYSHVCEREVDAIRKAAAGLAPNYKPKITFVICAKRHNMRFFPTKNEDADRTGNLKPGTVVDSTVTHPFAFDFYLQAHAGLQGTARPTHYVVLKDDIGFTADNMQMLCNNLCYSYARATRAVSLVPPAYYADIIANQCRFFVYNDDDSDNATSFSGMSKPQTRDFDPLLVEKRIRNSSAERVAWYM